MCLLCFVRVLYFHVHPRWDTSYPLREVNHPSVFAERLVNKMDEVGIERSVVLPISPYIKNNYVADVVGMYPDRLIGFASVQPNLGRYACEELEYAVNELGLVGLKLHPGIQGFSIMDPEVWNCLQLCGDLDIPVVIHCMKDDYSSLSFKTKPAPWINPVEYYTFLPYICPETTLIYAHMGGSFNFRKIITCASFPNVYLDTSYSLIQIAEEYPLERYIELVGSDKFLFGSDYVPLLTPERYGQKTQINIIRKLDIKEEDKNRILYKNSAKVLKLNS